MRRLSVLRVAFIGVQGVYLGYSWAIGQAPRFRPQPQDQQQGQPAGFGTPP